MADSIAARLRELRKRIHEENGCGLEPDCDPECPVCAWSLALEALAVEVEALEAENESRRKMLAEMVAARLAARPKEKP